MNNSVLIILEAIILVSALSIDAFVASFAYGSSKIKMPFSSVLVISFICSLALGLSLLAGSIFRTHIPEGLTIAICFTLLFILGLIKLLDSLAKSMIRKYSDLKKELTFSMFHLNFILQLYADPEKADVDCSKVISPREAISLSIAIALDGVAVGFGAAMGNAYPPLVFLSAVLICSLATHGLVVVLGSYLGNKIAHKLSFNLSWLSGAILIVLAFLKLT